VVQEVMIVLFNQAKAKGLQLSCPLLPFFFLLCKGWLNRLKKHLIRGNNWRAYLLMNPLQIWLPETELFEEKQQLFDAMFKK
jgi:hypothetical protein